MNAPDESLQKYNPRPILQPWFYKCSYVEILYIFVYLYVHFWQSKCIGRNIIVIWRPWDPSAGNTNDELIYSYIVQCGLNLSLFVDQSTISSISNNKVINENDTATIKCTVYSIPQSTIRWIFETNELQNKYDGSLTLDKIDCLSMGRYTCQAVNMLGVDNRSVDVTVKCEYLYISH